MKVYTLITGTHRILLERYFLPTFPFEKDTELIIRYGNQDTVDGRFDSAGFSETMRQKVALVLDAIAKNKGGDTIIYSDVDVQFFGKIKSVIDNYLVDYDICCIDDSPSKNKYGAGFFALRPSLHVAELFINVYNNLDNFRDDQPALNHFIATSDNKVGLLDKKLFWNTSGKKDYEAPGGVLVHHANWVIGVDEKIKLLDNVRNQINVETNEVR